MADTDGEPCVHLRAGRIHIERQVYEQLMPGCLALALLARDGAWFLLPLFGGAGGLQIKIRNARGDRVVEAQEFFRAQGLDDDHPPREFTLAPESGLGGWRLAVPAA
jgi:hypothetical protein